VNKSLAKGPAKAMPGVAAATPFKPNQPVRFLPYRSTLSRIRPC
jgi:hypothetical protein